MSGRSSNLSGPVTKESVIGLYGGGVELVVSMNSLDGGGRRVLRSCNCVTKSPICLNSTPELIRDNVELMLRTIGFPSPSPSSIC